MNVPRSLRILPTKFFSRLNVVSVQWFRIYCSLNPIQRIESFRFLSFFPLNGFPPFDEPIFQNYFAYMVRASFDSSSECRLFSGIFSAIFLSLSLLLYSVVGCIVKQKLRCFHFLSSFCFVGSQLGECDGILSLNLCVWTFFPLTLDCDVSLCFLSYIVFRPPLKRNNAPRLRNEIQISC